MTKSRRPQLQENRRQNVILEFASFTLFYLNEYGLIGGSEEELAAVSELMRQGKHVIKPYYPIPGCDKIPKYYVF